MHDVLSNRDQCFVHKGWFKFVSIMFSLSLMLFFINLFIPSLTRRPTPTLAPEAPNSTRQGGISGRTWGRSMSNEGLLKALMMMMMMMMMMMISPLFLPATLLFSTLFPFHLLKRTQVNKQQRTMFWA